MESAGHVPPFGPSYPKGHEDVSRPESERSLAQRRSALSSVFLTSSLLA
jgi:hypothetical protein